MGVVSVSYLRVGLCVGLHGWTDLAKPFSFKKRPHQQTWGFLLWELLKNNKWKVPHNFSQRNTHGIYLSLHVVKPTRVICHIDWLQAQACSNWATLIFFVPVKFVSAWLKVRPWTLPEPCGKHMVTSVYAWQSSGVHNKWEVVYKLQEHFSLRLPF